MRRVLLILAVAGVALVLFDSTAEAGWRHRAARDCCTPVCDPCCDPCDDCCGTTSCCGTSNGYASYYGGYRGWGMRGAGYRSGGYRPTRLNYATSYARTASYGGGCCN